MQAASTTSRGSRYGFCDVDQELLKDLEPLRDYNMIPIVSLQESLMTVKDQFENMRDMVLKAIKSAKDLDDRLTTDEVAAIFLYTMEGSSNGSNVYSKLNQALRSEHRNEIKPWYHYLKLILTALLKLPTFPCIAWRAVPLDLSEKYVKGFEIPWLAFSSCTSSIDVFQRSNQLPKTGKRTLFTIECFTGRSIKEYSQYKREDEVLLLPDTRFRVISILHTPENICIIHLREIPQSDYPTKPFWITQGKMIT